MNAVIEPHQSRVSLGSADVDEYQTPHLMLLRTGTKLIPASKQDLSLRAATIKNKITFKDTDQQLNAETATTITDTRNSLKKVVKPKMSSNYLADIDEASSSEPKMTIKST